MGCRSKSFFPWLTNAIHMTYTTIFSLWSSNDFLIFNIKKWILLKKNCSICAGMCAVKLFNDAYWYKIYVFDRDTNHNQGIAINFILQFSFIVAYQKYYWFLEKVVYCQRFSAYFYETPLWYAIYYIDVTNPNDFLNETFK